MIKHQDLKFVNSMFRVAKDLQEENLPGKSKHAACLVVRGCILAIGIPANRTDPFNLKFTQNQKKVYTHAELAAIKQVRYSNIDFRFSTLYVARAMKETPKRNAMYGESCPCSMCETAVKHFGIGRVVHTVENGIVEYFP